MRQGRVCVDAHAARASRGRARFTRSMHSRVTCTMMLHINIGTCTGHTHAHTRARARAHARTITYTHGSTCKTAAHEQWRRRGSSGSGPGQVWARSGVGRVRCGPGQGSRADTFRSGLHRSLSLFPLSLCRSPLSGRAGPPVHLVEDQEVRHLHHLHQQVHHSPAKIGRASCRERVCQYV